MATSPNYAQNVWPGGKFAGPGNKALAADPEAGAFLRLAYGLLLLDAFLTISRTFEILSLFSGVTLPYVAAGIHALAFGMAFVTGGIRRIATTRTGIFLVLFTGWMLICTPASSWRTGSVQTILNFWIPSLMSFLSIGVLSSVRQCRKFAMVLAFSGLTIAAASFVLGRTLQRFSFSGGTLGNANDLAMLLLLAAPFFLVPLFDTASKGATKFLALLACLLVAGVSFRTASRAGLLAVVAIVGVLFLTRSLAGKLKLTGAIVALAAMVVAFTPSYNLYRYTTIFSDSDSAQEARSETYGSSEIRRELLQQSLKATIEHPLLGVGPGVYASAMATESEREGTFAQWRVTHNAYTQVSAEMGIPGLILFLALIVSAYLDLLWVRGQSLKDPSLHALALGVLLSIVGLNVSYFFSSNAYMAWLLIPIGLGAMLRLNSKQEGDQRVNAIVRATPAPAPVRPAQAAKPGQAAAAPTPVPAPARAYTYRFLGRARKARH